MIMLHCGFLFCQTRQIAVSHEQLQELRWASTVCCHVCHHLYNWNDFPFLRILIDSAVPFSDLACFTPNLEPGQSALCCMMLCPNANFTELHCVTVFTLMLLNRSLTEMLMVDMHVLNYYFMPFSTDHYRKSSWCTDTGRLENLGHICPLSLPTWFHFISSPNHQQAFLCCYWSSCLQVWQ